MLQTFELQRNTKGSISVSSPGVEPGLRPSQGRVRIPHTPKTSLIKYPAEESNLVRQFRRLSCCPSHPQGKRADGGIRTRINRPFQIRKRQGRCLSESCHVGESKRPCRSNGARSRTPWDRFGICLLSQEHTAVIRSRAESPESRATKLSRSGLSTLVSGLSTVA